MVLVRGFSREIGCRLSSSYQRGSQYAEEAQRLCEGRMRSCRAVLILTALLTILMPLLEHFCKWDRFLQGGTDVEFGILALLLFAGLILLIAHQAATAPFFSMLFSHQLTEFPLRSLLVSACPVSACGALLAWCGCGAPLAAACRTCPPLRI